MLSAPILDNKDPEASSVFEPAALLREARRQKGLSLAEVPALCILDPDGDITRRLKSSGQAKLSNNWPAITPNFTNLRLRVEQLVSSAVPLERHSPFWLPKNSLPAAAEC